MQALLRVFDTYLIRAFNAEGHAGVLLFTFLPVLATTDVATTSSCCDLLMDEINQARQRLGPEANEVITWLESSLNNLVRTLLGSVALPL